MSSRGGFEKAEHNDFSCRFSRDVRSFFLFSFFFFLFFFLLSTTCISVLTFVLLVVCIAFKGGREGDGEQVYEKESRARQGKR